MTTRGREPTEAAGSADTTWNEDSPHGADGEASSGLAPGDVLGRYTLRSLVGEGGMGRVFAAHDGELGRGVALKVIRHEHRSTVRRARLLREAQAMARLSHPNVVTVYDVGTEGDNVFVAMELIEGQTLTEWIRAGGHGWREIQAMFLAAGRGLAAAHAVGIVHRDFKPHNVLLGRGGRVVVADFGLARGGGGDSSDPSTPPAPDLGRELTTSGEQLGTPAYMAPEQHAGGEITARADQYAFCVALHEALAGRRPFPGEIPSLRPRFLAALLTRGLAGDPARRYPSMEALLADLARDPGRTARRAALVVLGAGVAAAAFARSGAATPDCGAGAALAAAVWPETARAGVRAAFEATAQPYAAESFVRFDQALRGRLGLWAAAHRDACEATHVRHEQSEALLDARMACLDRARRGLGALVEVLGHDVEPVMIHRAASTVDGMGDVTRCTGAAALTTDVAPPPDPAAKREIDALGGELDRIEAGAKLGHYKQTLEAGRALLPRARAAGYAPLLARALTEVGRLEALTGDVDAGIKMLYDAAGAGGAGRSDAVTARALAMLLRPVGIARGRLDEARGIMRIAEGAVARAGNAPADWAYLLSEEGAVLSTAGDAMGALLRFATVIALEEQLHGADSERVGMGLTNLALVERPLGLFRQAREHQRRAMVILGRALGPDHPTSNSARINLAVQDYHNGDLPAAAAGFAAALATDERLFGKDHVETSRDAANLAQIDVLLGKLGEARGLAERTVRIREAAFGKDQRQLGLAYRILALVDMLDGRLESAEALSRHDLAIQEQAHKPGERALSEPLQMLAQILVRRGHGAEARALVERAVAILETTAAAQADLAEALRLLAEAYGAEGRHADAVKTAERALALTVATRAEGHRDRVQSLLVLARALTGAKGGRRAVETAEQALAGAMARPDDAGTIADAALALSQALWPLGKGERERARALARSAQARLAPTELAAQRAELDGWLATIR